jgi:hypothetical protein
MGHANLENLSTLFLNRLYAKGKTSIAQACDVALKKKQYVKASEGVLNDDCDIRNALGMIAAFYLQDHELERGKEMPVIELAKELTPEQDKVLQEWLKDDTMDWDCGNDGNGGEYGVFDSIEWKLTKEWRKVFRRIHILTNITV